MNDRELEIRALEPVSSAPIDVAARPLPAEVSPLRKVHRHLRGRYPLAIFLALVGMAGGAAVGWKAVAPLYRGAGLIHVAPSMPSPQDPAGISVLPMFEGFMSYQVQILESPRATRMALETEAWRKTGEGTGPDAVEEFEERREIVYRRGTQHIQVQFLDPRPEVAIGGVHALLEAYRKLADELNAADDRVDYAREQVELLTGRIKSGTDQILMFTSEFGGQEGLEIRHRAGVEQVLATKGDLEKVQSAIRDYEVASGGTSAASPIPAGEIAVDNPQMAQYLLDLAVHEAEEAMLAERLGDRNERIIALRQTIRVLKKRIELFAADWNRMRATTNAGGVTLDELKARETRLAERLAVLQDESRTIGRTRVDVDRLQAENDDMTRRLRQMEALGEQLKAQLVGKGRITFPDPGVRPTAPYKDRRVPYAGMGGAAGAGLGLLIVFLLGLFDPRLKSAGDIDDVLSRVKLLGLLPSLPTGLGDAAGRAVATQCVDQIRTLLQIVHARDHGACVCVSGPGVGSGKTTLTAALGLSFAASGSRTLLIDADLTGRGLTRRVIRMLMGHVRTLAGSAPSSPKGEDAPHEGVEDDRFLLAPLLAESAARGGPTPTEFGDLLSDAIERLGLERARESGVVDDLFALADLLHSSEGRDELAARLMAALAARGLLASGSPSEWIPARAIELGRGRTELNGSPVERYVFRTGLDSLRFLPLRGVGRGGGVSVATIAKILARVRKEFDVVLVDTGPVPGSVESSMVAAQADAVVMVVSPGDHRPDAERAMAHMAQIGAQVAGVVFNRAGEKDIFRTSRSRSSVRSGDPGA